MHQHAPTLMTLLFVAAVFPVSGCTHQQAQQGPEPQPHATTAPGTAPDEQTLDAAARQPQRLTDFTDPTLNQRWQMVNDNVMGGRSKGTRSFENGIMTFTGEINTNGGGFSSVRTPIAAGTLAETQAICLRLRADGRTYRLLLQDNLPRGRSIIFRIDLPLDPDRSADQWQTITIDLDDLVASHHGDPVDASKNGGPLDRSRAVRLGLMLNDTHDGPFRLEVDWIELIPRQE